MAIPVWAARVGIALNPLLFLLPVPQTDSVLFSLLSHYILEAAVSLPSVDQASILVHRGLLKLAVGPILPAFYEKVQELAVFAASASCTVQLELVRIVYHLWLILPDQEFTDLGLSSQAPRLLLKLNT